MLGVLALAVFSDGRFSWRRLGAVLLAGTRLVLAGLLLLYGFHRYFEPHSNSLAFVNPGVRTHLVDFLVFFGLFIFLLLSFWARELMPAVQHWSARLLRPARAAPAGWQRWLAWPQRFWEKEPRRFYAVALLVLGVALFFFFEQGLLAILLLLLALSAYLLLRRPLSPEQKLATWMAWLGLAVVCGCEIVHVRDFMGVGGDMSRMNTVFKFYMIVWIYFALAATAAWAALMANPAQPARRARTAAAHRSARGGVRRTGLRDFWERYRLRGGWDLLLWTAGVLVVWAVANFFQANGEFPGLTLVLAFGILLLPWLWAGWPRQDFWAKTWVATLAAILLAVSLYPPISLYDRMRLCSQFRRPTLNGLAYLDQMNPQDAKALAWINGHVRSNDIVLEAPGVKGYNCFDTRVAIFTGQPTLIGWIGQEEQMRYQPALTESHTRDADRIFQTSNIEEARRLLDRYHVQYVYVGAIERQAYPGLGLDKFRAFMDVVYDQDGVTIYRRRAAE